MHVGCEKSHKLHSQIPRAHSYATYAQAHLHAHLHIRNCKPKLLPDMLWAAEPIWSIDCIWRAADLLGRPPPDSRIVLYAVPPSQNPTMCLPQALAEASASQRFLLRMLADADSELPAALPLQARALQ